LHLWSIYPQKLVWLSSARGLTTHLVFIGLQRAYDTVTQNKLWTSLVINGVSLGYVNTVRSFYTDCTAMVKMGSQLSQEFRVTKILPQGCTLAPTLFKIYLEEALKSWKIKC